MNKTEFLKKLEKNLKYLKRKEKQKELIKYLNIESENLNPIEEANKIYESKGLKIKINDEIKLFDAINIIIRGFKSQKKEIIKNLVLFFLYLFLIIILIKMPFIYTRDMISNLFNSFFTTDTSFILWNLLFELIYAITSIIMLIKLIKKKALEIKKMCN